MEETFIEVEVGVGLNQFFPEKIKIIISNEDETNNEELKTNNDGKKG